MTSEQLSKSINELDLPIFTNAQVFISTDGYVRRLESIHVIVCDDCGGYKVILSQ
jgi:hypothetical protein